MICLIPVSRFRISFEVAAGRPFSQLERMVLRAIREGVGDLASMRAAFQVHPRILIEALVTLTQAGWVALSNLDGSGFLLTSEGARATGESNPPATTVTTTKQTFMLVERLTGALIGNDEVRFRSAAQLESVWDDAIKLKAEFHDNAIDEGQVRRLLPRRQGEWVRWVGPIEMISKAAHWIPVGVDTAANTIVGLPERWRARLEPVILEEARRRESSVSSNARARQWTADRDREPRFRGHGIAEEEAPRPDGWPVEILEDDLLVGGVRHETALAAALAEAVSSVFVSSAFLNASAVDRLSRPLLDAMRRGVNVDLLWGYAVSEEKGEAPLESLKKLAYEARRDGGAGALRFNRSASGSHAKLLLFDRPSGMEACLGSYNWLSTSAANSQREMFNVSVRLRAAGVVSELCGCAAGLWAGVDSDTLSSTADRWRSAAAELEGFAASRGNGDQDGAKAGGTTARLVFDREHEGVLRDLTAGAQQRLLVFSHRLGPIAEGRLVRSGEAAPAELWVCYGHSELGEEWISAVSALVRRAGGTLLNVPAVHAKLIVSDASACVSSYNFLSADPFGKARRAREIGVLLEGGQVAAWLSERAMEVVGSAKRDVPNVQRD